MPGKLAGVLFLTVWCCVASSATINKVGPIPFSGDAQLGNDISNFSISGTSGPALTLDSAAEGGQGSPLFLCTGGVECNIRHVILAFSAAVPGFNLGKLSNQNAQDLVGQLNFVGTFRPPDPAPASCITTGCSFTVPVTMNGYLTGYALTPAGCVSPCNVDVPAEFSVYLTGSGTACIFGFATTDTPPQYVFGFVIDSFEGNATGRLGPDSDEGDESGSLAFPALPIFPGAHTAQSNSRFPTGLGAHPSAVDESGKFLYVQETSARQISAFAVDRDLGVLRPVPGSPFPTRVTPESVVVDPTGRFLYVMDSGERTFDVFAIDRATGVLRPIGPPTLPQARISIRSARSRDGSRERSRQWCGSTRKSNFEEASSTLSTRVLECRTRTTKSGLRLGNKTGDLP